MRGPRSTPRAWHGTGPGGPAITWKDCGHEHIHAFHPPAGPVDGPVSLSPFATQMAERLSARQARRPRTPLKVWEDEGGSLAAPVAAAPPL